MGWCSATEIFDNVCEELLGDKSKVEVIKSLIDSLEQDDWDCQFDSKFIAHPIVQQAFIELNSDNPAWD